MCSRAGRGHGGLQSSPMEPKRDRHHPAYAQPLAPGYHTHHTHHTPSIVQSHLARRALSRGSYICKKNLAVTKQGPRARSDVIQQTHASTRQVTLQPKRREYCDLTATPGRCPPRLGWYSTHKTGSFAYTSSRLAPASLGRVSTVQKKQRAFPRLKHLRSRR